MNLLRLISLAMFCCVLNCGCEQAATHSQDDSGSHSHSHSHGDSTHSHGHDPTDGHTHQESEPDGIHGINGGHVFSFEPGDYVGEWLVTNDDDVTKIFILDKAARSNVAVKVENFELRKGDSIFTLDPENVDEEGKTAIYSLNDQDLSIAINLGVEVTMQIGDQKYIGKISALAPHSH